MKEPLISVIIPIFNVEEYVSECIESVMKQSYQNIQIILVDDGSTDMSGKICDKYVQIDHRIEVIHQKNKGLVLARKSGLKKAIGDYTGFVDGDDYIEYNMYAELLKEIIKCDADFIHSGFITGNEIAISSKKEIIEFNSRENREDFIIGSIFNLSNRITPSIWSKLFKTEFIKRNYSRVPDNIQYGEDVFNLCICIENCNKCILIDKAYYHYRYRQSSIINEIGLSNLQNIFRYYMNIYKKVEEYKNCDEVKEFLIEEECKTVMRKFRKDESKDFQKVKYYYALPETLQGKKIIIYGAGAVGRDYYTQIRRYTECNVVAWVDCYPEKYNYPYIKLYKPEILSVLEFDILIIAVKQKKVAEEIIEQLKIKGIDINKIVWIEPQFYSSFDK